MTEKKDTEKPKRLPHARRKKKSEEISPKIESVRGSLMAQYKSCGRANCRCSKGSKHGPFFYHVWYVRGRRHKRYVRKADLEQTKAGIEALRAQMQKRQEEVAEIKAILRENRETHRRLYAILRLGGFNL